MGEREGEMAAVREMGFGPAGRVLLQVTKVVAIAGGLVFVALVAMELVSIVGRKLFSAPVPGDVEILQMGAAFASATFFAYCHLIGGDVKVDFFTHHMSRRRDEPAGATVDEGAAARAAARGSVTASESRRWRAPLIVKPCS